MGSIAEGSEERQRLFPIKDIAGTPSAPTVDLVDLMGFNSAHEVSWTLKAEMKEFLEVHLQFKREYPHGGEDLVDFAKCLQWARR